MRKYSGVAGIGIFITVSTIIVILGYRSPEFTLSNHTSLNLPSQISFCVFGCIASLLIAHSLLLYVPHRWKLGGVYRILAGIVAAAFFTSCLFPNNPNAYTMHDYASWVAMGSGFVFGVFLLIRLWSSYRLLNKVVNILVLIIMLTVFGAMILDYVFFRSLVLIFESGMIVSIFALMLSLIFGRPETGVRAEPKRI